MPAHETWGEAALIDLRRMWDAGLSASTIGRAVGKSKNSVVSKVHRLGLAGRPSPIKPSCGPITPRGMLYREAAERKRAAAAAASVGDVELVIPAKPAICGAITRAGLREQDRLRKAAAADLPESKPAEPHVRVASAPRLTCAAVSDRPLSRDATCQYIAGHARPWAMCGAPAIVGRAWCPAHYRVVYQGAADRVAA